MSDLVQQLLHRGVGLSLSFLLAQSHAAIPVYISYIIHVVLLISMCDCMWLPWLWLFCLSLILTYSDPTLTLDNLLSALEPVTNWDWLGMWLHVPWSRLKRMAGKEAMLQDWVKSYPLPSWYHVACALYKRRGVTEHGVLKQLYGKYLTGMCLCYHVLHICKNALFSRGIGKG